MSTFFFFENSTSMNNNAILTSQKHLRIQVTPDLHLTPLSHWDATFAIVLQIDSQSQTVAKRSHGIAKSSQASRTGRERFAKFSKDLCDKNHRKTIAKSSHLSRTRCKPIANPSQTHCKSVSTIHTVRQICDTNANRCDRNKTISRRNCGKIKLIDIRKTVARHSRVCLTTVVRYSCDYLMTVAQVSLISLRICRDHNVQRDCHMKLSKICVYIAELCLELVANLSHPNEILA